MILRNQMIQHLAFLVGVRTSLLTFPLSSWGWGRALHCQDAKGGCGTGTGPGASPACPQQLWGCGLTLPFTAGLKGLCQAPAQAHPSPFIAVHLYGRVK